MCTLNPCVITKFRSIAYMLLLIAHVLLLTALRSLLIAHMIGFLVWGLEFNPIVNRGDRDRLP